MLLSKDSPILKAIKKGEKYSTDDEKLKMMKEDKNISGAYSYQLVAMTYGKTQQIQAFIKLLEKDLKKLEAEKKKEKKEYQKKQKEESKRWTKGKR